MRLVIDQKEIETPIFDFPEVSSPVFKYELKILYIYLKFILFIIVEIVVIYLVIEL
jgi:hypothetical protein